MPGKYFLPKSCLIIDYDFYTCDEILVLAQDVDLDAVFVVKVTIHDWKWTNDIKMIIDDSDMENVDQGHILHSFDLGMKPIRFLVNNTTKSLTVSSSRDISIFCL